MIYLLHLRLCPLLVLKGLYRYLGTFARLVERQARATRSNGQGQSSSSRGSSFDDFKKLSPPYFSDTEAEAWIMMIEKFFIVIDCFEEQKKKKKTLLCNIYVRQRGRSLVAHD